MFKESNQSIPAIIVFTDLDGTLLDHQHYSFSAARQALQSLVEINAALVLASSKTGAEMARIAQELPIRPAAMIAENGAGVIWEDRRSGGSDCHDALMTCLDSLPYSVRSGFSGFTDWGPERVALETGLPPEEASLAARRTFSEPGLWSGSETEREQFLSALAEKGVTARQGGRYLTLSFGADKADRMEEVAARVAPGAFRLALGDAPNDVAMLEAADLGIIISNLSGAGIAELSGESTGTIRRTVLQGPEGWNQAVLEVLNQQGLIPATDRR